MTEAIERLRKDLQRSGGFGPQIVSTEEAVVEKADLRAVLDALTAPQEPVADDAELPINVTWFSQELHEIFRKHFVAWGDSTDWEKIARKALDSLSLRAAISRLQAKASETGWQRPYRTMDESGTPTDAGTVGWNWIGELAQRERENDAALLVIQDTPVRGGGKVIRLYRSTTLLAVATTFRDDMNFTVLVRWKAPETGEG